MAKFRLFTDLIQLVISAEHGPSLSGLHSFCFDPDDCNQPEPAERRGDDGGLILPPRQTLCAVAQMPITDPKNLSADGPAIADEHHGEHSHD